MARVYVSIGSNIARERNIRLAISRLRERYGALEISSIYESEPVGFEGECFYNVAVGLECDDAPDALVKVFRAIENETGRSRDKRKYGPRTLDIDLLLYDDLVCAENGIRLPREEIIRFAFVLRPLAEIAGDLRHPTAEKSLAELWSEFDDSGQGTRRLRGEASGSPVFSGNAGGSPGGAARGDQG